jgi:hypothetical protein
VNQLERILREDRNAEDRDREEGTTKWQENITEEFNQRRGTSEGNVTWA